jgi:ABC-type Zn uptake system ZnuABC Zn-binding protein ZnuA
VTPAGARAASSALALLYVDDSMDGWAARMDAPARIPFSGMVAADRIRHYDDNALDPHLWLDPATVSAALPKLVEAIAARDPGGAEIYRRNADAFAKELDALDRELAETLKPLQGRAVIQFHPSMFYFLSRYGIQTASVIESIAGQEPSPKQIKELADLIRAQHVEVIVSEPQLADAPVRALAEASGARIAHLDPLGGVPGRETYADLLRYNANALREAFQ